MITTHTGQQGIGISIVRHNKIQYSDRKAQCSSRWSQPTVCTHKLLWHLQLGDVSYQSKRMVISSYPQPDQCLLIVPWYGMEWYVNRALRVGFVSPTARTSKDSTSAGNASKDNTPVTLTSYILVHIIRLAHHKVVRTQ